MKKSSAITKCTKDTINSTWEKLRKNGVTMVKTKRFAKGKKKMVATIASDRRHAQLNVLTLHTP